MLNARGVADLVYKLEDSLLDDVLPPMRADAQDAVINVGEPRPSDWGDSSRWVDWFGALDSSEFRIESREH